jgi:hypothetical protein
MPLLKIVAACEKVIYDREGPASLIGIFEEMKFQLLEAPLPDKAIAPNQWAVFTQWEPLPSDTGIPFTQVVRVYAPDGSLYIENEHTVVSIEPNRLHLRVRINVRSLPVWKEGIVQVKVFLKGNDTELGSTSFRIVYVAKEEAAHPPAIAVGATAPN